MNSVWFKTLLSKYKGQLQRAAGEGCYVCVPQSCSLDLSPISASLVDLHILRQKPNVKGEFTALSGEEVMIKECKVFTGKGFKTSVVANVLSMRSEPVGLPDGQHGKLHICFISRPLQGGIEAPASVDDLSPASLNEFMAFLCLSPDAEEPISRLNAELELLRREFTKEGGATWESVSQWLALGEMENGGTAKGDEEVGFGASSNEKMWEATPLALQFQDIISHTVKELFECCDSLAPQAHTSGVVSESLYRRVTLCLQAHACRRLHATILPHLRRALSLECTLLGNRLGSAASLPPASCAAVLGIKAAYVCSQDAAQEILGGMQDSLCPLSKLQVLSSATEAIKASLEEKLLSDGVDLFDVAIGGDEIVPLMTYVLAQGFAKGPGTDVHKTVAELPLHLTFSQLFHHPDAGPLHKCRMGYNLANWSSSCAETTNNRNQRGVPE